MKLLLLQGSKKGKPPTADPSTMPNGTTAQGRGRDLSGKRRKSFVSRFLKKRTNSGESSFRKNKLSGSATGGSNSKMGTAAETIPENPVEASEASAAAAPAASPAPAPAPASDPAPESTNKADKASKDSAEKVLLKELEEERPPDSFVTAENDSSNEQENDDDKPAEPESKKPSNSGEKETVEQEDNGKKKEKPEKVKEGEKEKAASRPKEESKSKSSRNKEKGKSSPPPRRATTPPSLLGTSIQKGGVSVLDDAKDSESYDKIPLLEMTRLPRGGASVETGAVGRVQFGIPPETIKDSMRLGLGVPCVYIVPVERFCREMGAALGVNLAEFEFPAYFNFFVQRRRCTLIVDSLDAEKNIRKVFSETLLGPAQFRRPDDPIAYQEEDFDPSFPREAIPNFAKELKHFRIMPGGKELELETLLQFAYFETPTESECQTLLGVPPPLGEKETSALEKAMVEMNGENKLKDRRPSLDEMSLDDAASRVGTGKAWTYSQVKWVGDVATVYPPDATPEQIATRSCKRVEIFKMPGGTEYILHDIDENSHIIGKARFFGHVKVPESLSVAGWAEEEKKPETDAKGKLVEGNGADITVPRNMSPPTFHPPSFGVTVLGNSHGFDKSGSTSGYVLWINGRGVMIDPPPYSSATLEREGIRPRTIVGIIVTHCHADHDAGAFQKVLTGSPVVVITTPTIYESFIRKYAALSALSPALLRHSHRHKSAIIGQPLRFQGATFHFTYTLHSIPCVGFRVEWRGRSMVFTGDHMNIPEQIDKLQDKGVLTKARADDLRELPLQETDLLLHESGAPPIHTPLDVLMKLPQRVKRRLYVVHTSALPEGCELRVAPTGTAGTIRLDQLALPDTSGNDNPKEAARSTSVYTPRVRNAGRRYSSISEDIQVLDFSEDMNEYGTSHYGSVVLSDTSKSSKSDTDKYNRMTSVVQGTSRPPPLVALRPTSSTDAWFILNLLSAVPFLSSLSYASTMEVLETARVDAYCVDDVVVPASRRRDVLCVVWEGTCLEREEKSGAVRLLPKEKLAIQKAPRRRSSAVEKAQRAVAGAEEQGKKRMGAVWHAGDWTGPRALQPEKRLSGESTFSKTHDIVAMSTEGVKVITVEFSNLHAILQSGSVLYRKYLARKKQQAAADNIVGEEQSVENQMKRDAARNLNIIELLDCNSSLRKLSAVQKRHLESLAEGPDYYAPGQRLWKAGGPVNKAFIIIVGTAAFLPRRRFAGSVGMAVDKKGTHKNPPTGDGNNPGEEMRKDALKAMKELEAHEDDSTISSCNSDHIVGMMEHGQEPAPGSNEFIRLELGLKSRAEKASSVTRRRSSSSSVASQEEQSDSSHSGVGGTGVPKDRQSRSEVVEEKKGRSAMRRSSSKDRIANKFLERLYNQRAFTAGLVFSRGHFLGDVSKMVAGLLATDYEGDDQSFKYGFGDQTEGGGDKNPSKNPVGEMTIHERESDKMVVHSSTLAAGKEGCSVISFDKDSLIPFLDEYPGLLLSLLGTQVVV